MTYKIAKAAEFGITFGIARKASSLIKAATSEFFHAPGTAYYLAENGRSGFAIRHDGELVYVWSLDPGNGSAIVSAAIANGAVYLDCFDGYLPTLYGRHGFSVDSRVPNWTPGEPDVVYMSLPGFSSRNGVQS